MNYNEKKADSKFYGFHCNLPDFCLIRVQGWSKDEIGVMRMMTTMVLVQLTATLKEVIFVCFNVIDIFWPIKPLCLCMDRLWNYLFLSINTLWMIFKKILQQSAINKSSFLMAAIVLNKVSLPGLFVASPRNQL